MRTLILSAVCVAVMANGVADAAPQAPEVTCTVGGKLFKGRETCRRELDAIPALSGRAASGVAARGPARTALAATSPTAAIEPPPKIIHKGTLVIRRDLDDLGGWSRLSKLQDATGAQFSWTDDRVTGNQVWVAQGLVGYRFASWQTPSLDAYLQNSVLGVYALFDRAVNTKRTGEDKGDLSLGLASQTAFANVFNATHYFNGRGGWTTDFYGNDKSWFVGLDYQPVGNPRGDGRDTFFSYLGTPLAAGPWFFFTLSPKFRTEYRANIDESVPQAMLDPIFSVRREAFRYGPWVQAMLAGNNAGFADVPDWIRRLTLQATYGWYFDALSPLRYKHLYTSLTYNLDAAGYVGVTVSYQRGQKETTGATEEIAKIALSVKYGSE
jgi:hypothetical protein